VSREAVERVRLPLCESYLQMVGGGAELEEVHYFSAYANHLQHEAPDKPKRHRKFVRALTASKVIAHIGRFYPKPLVTQTDERLFDALSEVVDGARQHGDGAHAGACPKGEMDRVPSGRDISQTAYIGEWLKAANPVFDNSTPLQVIERGEADRIWQMISRLQAGEPV